MSKARRLRRERHVLHGILATGAACMFGLGVGLAAAELLVRLGVPEQEFWSVAPVYHPVEAPSVHYTLEPNLWGRRQYLAWRDQGTPQSSPAQNGPPPIDPDWMGAIDDLPPPASLDVGVAVL